MKSYEVTISWRPDINSLDRTSRTFTIAARSQASAVFQAAYKLGWTANSYLGGSEQVTVQLLRGAW